MKIFLLLSSILGLSQAAGFGDFIGGAPVPSLEPTTPLPCGIGPVRVDGALNTTIDATVGQINWIVSVQAKKLGISWSHKCTGTLISNKAVLTTASCIDGLAKMSGSMRIQGGTVDYPKAGFFRRRRAIFTKYPGKMEEGQAYVQTQTTHPAYNKATGENNLAILKLTSPLDFNKAAGKMNAICLPVDAAEPSNLFTAGWGALGDAVPKMRLQIAPIEPEACSSVITKAKEEFCAEQQGPGCEGDIGGPVFTDNLSGPAGSQLYALTVRGRECQNLNTTAMPIIYTKIFPHIAWINKEMKSAI